MFTVLLEIKESLSRLADQQDNKTLSEEFKVNKCFEVDDFKILNENLEDETYKSMMVNFALKIF